MIDLVLAFGGGLLGSAHCLGMCGAFVLALGARQRGIANLLRQILYGLGRVFTYTFGGLLAGYGAWRLTDVMGSVVNLQAILAIAAGILLMGQGLVSAGVVRLRSRLAGEGPCLGPSLFNSLLTATRLHNVFLGGVVNGFLPCGLVYAYLALAASRGNVWQGGLTMAAFGLGTLPALTLLGWGGQFLQLAARRHVVHVAAWCVVATGILSLGRGVVFLSESLPFAEARCPLCP